jgi:hypothetical protein
MLEGIEQQWFLRTGLIILIVGPLVLVLKGYSAPVVGTFGAICALAIVFVVLSNVQSFVFGPLRAQMREEVSRARATIEQVQNLAADLSGIALTSVQESGRLGGSSQKERFDARATVVNRLKDLGLSDDQIGNTTRRFNDYVEMDMKYKLMDQLRASDQNNTDRNKKMAACFNLNQGGFLPRQTSEIKSCIEANMAVNDDTNELFLDLEYFEKTQNLRRPEVFFALHTK